MMSNDCDNDLLPEIATSEPKTSILLFPVVGRRRNRLGQFLRCGRGGKPQISRRNFSDICHTVGDISTSGLDGLSQGCGCDSASSI